MSLNDGLKKISGSDRGGYIRSISVVSPISSPSHFIGHQFSLLSCGICKNNSCSISIPIYSQELNLIERAAVIVFDSGSRIDLSRFKNLQNRKSFMKWELWFDERTELDRVKVLRSLSKEEEEMLMPDIERMIKEKGVLRGIMDLYESDAITNLSKEVREVYKKHARTLPLSEIQKIRIKYLNDWHQDLQLKQTNLCFKEEE